MIGKEKGRTALVLGASRGIGRGVARHLGRAGYHVAISSRSATRSDIVLEEGSDVLPSGTLEETAAEIEALGGKAVVLPCDLTDDRQIETMVPTAARALGRIDVLVNCSQFGGGIDGRFWEKDMAFYDAQMGAGPRAAYAVSRLVVPIMLAQGTGLIVNISATGSLVDLYSVPYRMGRSALDRLTQALAEDLPDTGIHAVTIWPAMIRTERVEGAARGAATGIPSLETYDLDAHANSPDAVGIGVAHLAADPQVGRLSGRGFGLGELARLYGFHDLDGRPIDNPLSLTRLDVGDGRVVAPHLDRRGLLKSE